MTAGDGRLDLGLFVGGNVFGSELELGNSFFADQVPRSALLLGLRGSYAVLPAIAAGSALAPRLAVELEVKMVFSTTEGDTDAMRESYFAPVLGWRAQGRFSLLSDRRLSPFAVLGLGGETVFTGSPFVANGDTDSAWHWGLGADYDMAPNYGLRADFRHGMTAGRVAAQSNIIEFHLGFFYTFSGSGAASAVAEKAPSKSTGTVQTVPMDAGDEPEPGPGAPDTDGDGIPDSDDQCPNRAETVNEIEDEDGCPESDPDADGLVGTADRCPDQAEDIDGFKDEDGCADRDNDLDGRPDSIDACPLEPETRNGFEDADGCPDAVPEQLVALTGVLSGVRFRGRSAQLLRTSNLVLTRVIAVLRKFPNARVRISGHTDSRGNAERNRELSLKRAEAVRLYLVTRGIDGARIEVAGHGGDKSEQGAEQSGARIELGLIPGPEQVAEPAGTETTAPATE